MDIKDREWNMKKTCVLIVTIQLFLMFGIISYLFYLNSRNTNSSLSFQQTEKGSYTLYIGTNDKDTYTQLIPTDKAQEIVNQICVKYVDGFTVQIAHGGWLDEVNEFTDETTLVYRFTNVDEQAIVQIMEEALVALNQNTILIEKEDVNYCYYDGKEDKE